MLTHKSYSIKKRYIVVMSFLLLRNGVASSNRLTIASGGNATFAAKVFSTSTVSGDIGTTLVTKDYVDSGDGSSINTILITVAAVGGGNRYFLDGVQQANAVLQPGFTYRFDQSNATNNGHPLRFSTNNNNSPAAPYTTGVTAVGTPGSSGAYTQIITTQATPVTLYYYCTIHSGMGGAATIRIIKTDGNATFAGDITLGDDLNFTTNGFADISNTGTGAMRFKPSGQTLALTLTGANSTFAGTVDAKGFRTTSGSTDYSLLTRNSTNTAVYIQQAGTGNILDVRYGSQAAGQGTSAFAVNSSGNSTFTGLINLDGTNQIYFVPQTGESNTEAMRIVRFSDTMFFTYGVNANEEAFSYNSSGDTTFAGDVKIAEASNKGQLFFGTANTDYEIKRWWKLWLFKFKCSYITI